MMDYLEPQVHPSEDVLMCMNCGCDNEPLPEHRSPEANCIWPLCDCHSTYWQTVPELEKRRLWGDR